jgi:hypothetical protein
LSDNRRSSNFANTPQMAQPIIMISPEMLRTIQTAQRPPYKPNGKRYAVCADCNKGKIFICFKGNENACDKGVRETHTHFRCECAGGRNVVFAGAVQFRTKVIKQRA